MAKKSKKRKKNPSEKTWLFLLGGAVVLGVGGYFLFRKPTATAVKLPTTTTTPGVQTGVTQQLPGTAIQQQAYQMPSQKAYYNVARSGFQLDGMVDSEVFPLNSLQVLPTGQIVLPGGSGGDNIALTDPAGIPWKAQNGMVVTAGHDAAYMMSGSAPSSAQQAWVNASAQQQYMNPPDMSFQNGIPDPNYWLSQAIGGPLMGNPWGTAW